MTGGRISRERGELGRSVNGEDPILAFKQDEVPGKHPQKGTSGFNVAFWMNLQNMFGDASTNGS